MWILNKIIICKLFNRTTHIDSKFKYKELFPQEKENLGLFNEEIKKIHHNTQENQIVLEEKTNNDGRYSKMSEEQAENLYQERFWFEIR